MIGKIFQIRDDYMNLHSVDYTSNKGVCEDLTEGKFSFPVIHSIRSNTENRQLINILKQKPTEITIKKYAVDYMERTGSFVYTRKILKELTEKALLMIRELDDGTGEGNGVKAVVDMLIIE